MPTGLVLEIELCRQPGEELALSRAVGDLLQELEANQFGEMASPVRKVTLCCH